MKFYEDIGIGDVEVFPGRYTLTEKNITAVGNEWDPQPFHTDAGAAKDSFYGGLVASTVHLFAISVKLSHTAPDILAAVSSLGLTDMTNHAPGYLGDTIECRATYIEKRESKSRPGVGIMKAQSQLFNQGGELLFSYMTTALYRMKEFEGNP